MLPKPSHQFRIANTLHQLRASLWKPPKFNTMSGIANTIDREEQAMHELRQKNYYPVQIGSIYNDRYRVVGKLGSGAYSSVWLAEDKRLINLLQLTVPV